MSRYCLVMPSDAALIGLPCPASRAIRRYELRHVKSGVLPSSLIFYVVRSLSAPFAKAWNLVSHNHHRNQSYLRSLSITYGTSTSSSVLSSAVISKMTFFWCSGIFFFEMVSTSSLNLCKSKINFIQDMLGRRITYLRGSLSFNLLGG